MALMLRGIAMFIFLLFCAQTKAQVPLTEGSPTVFIDFSAATPISVGSNPGTAFTGAGFQPGSNPPPPSVGPGRLNSNAWEVLGISGFPLNFGGTQIGNRLGLGAVNNAQVTAGIYAYTGTPHSASNPALMIQPGVEGFGGSNPGTITLRIQNNGMAAITQLQLSYDIFFRNDQARNTYLNFSWSYNHTTYTAVPGLNFTTPAAADAIGWQLASGPAPSRSTTLNGLNILPGSYFYLRWSIGDGPTGSGARDELGLDNISINAVYGPPCTQPTTQASAVANNVLPEQLDLNITRGNGTGGLLIVAVENATLNNNPFNGMSYAANSTFGLGDPVANGFAVYNSNAIPTGGNGTVTILGLNPATTYHFYLFEYNGVGSPCYRTQLSHIIQGTPPSSANPAVYFRSRQSGNWNDANTWEYTSDTADLANFPWTLSDVRPTSAALWILIDSNHTVTLTNNESASRLHINYSGRLANSSSASGGRLLTMVDNAGDDIVVQGTLELFGNVPTLVPGLTVRVDSLGMVHALHNNGNSASDDFARSAQVTFMDGAIFNWDNNLSFETAGSSYFPNNAATPRVAIFRVSKNIAVGAGSNTIIQGLLEANANITWQNAGQKTFRNGITGTGNIVQDATCGKLVINGSSSFGMAKLGGTGTIQLNSDATNGVLEFPSNSWAYLTSDKTVNGGSLRITANGFLNLRHFVLSGTTNFQVASAGKIGIGHPQGITTGAVGNIQTTTRTLDANGYYQYTGVIDQVTGNLLPSTVSRLIVDNAVAPFHEGVPGITVEVSDPVTITTTTQILNTCVLSTGSSILTLGPILQYLGGPGGLITGKEDGTLAFSGSGNPQVNFADSTQLGTILMKKSAGQAIFASTGTNGLFIHHGIEFDATNAGTLNVGNQRVTLRSKAAHTAYFGRIYGGASGLNNFTVERFIPTGLNHGKSWQLLGVPLTTTQTINAAWQEGATFATENPNPGYGTMITGSVPGATNPAIGFDAHTPLGATMRTYDPLTNNWVDIPNTKTRTITEPKGFMVLVRGDRDVMTHNAPATPTILRAKGSLYAIGSGNVTPPTTNIDANSFQSVGNPYACTVDFDQVFKALSTDNMFYVWDPLLPGSSGLGGWQTINGNIGYLVTPGGTANYPGGPANPEQFIQSGQAFLVHATGGAGGLVFQEQCKTPTPNKNLFRTPVRVSMLQTFLHRANNSMADGNTLALGAQFSNDPDGRSSRKVNNPDENFGISAHATSYAVLTRRSLAAGDTIRFAMSNLRAGEYTLRFRPHNFNLREDVYLVDHFTGTRTLISKHDTSLYNFSISTQPGSYQPARFCLVFGRNLPTSTVNDILFTVAPNPIRGKHFNMHFENLPAGTYHATLTGAAGRAMRTYTFTWSNDLRMQPFELPGVLPAGTYRLVVKGAQWQGTKILVVQ